MDAYPDDLLAGVFPLVFAVDGILPSDSSPPPLKNEDEGTSNDDQKEEVASTRSLFDRFLDAIAASLNEEEQNSPKQMNRTGSDTIASLLRGEDKDDSSDDEDDRSQDSSRRLSIRRNSPMTSFRQKKNHTGSNSTAYARVLSSESFFQRARILSISTKHGFPPSKDPDGSQNRALLLSQSRPTMAQGATGANALRLKNILENKSTEGILPAGWLEKHVHALPSVLLVVATLSAKGSNQEAQNQHLLETMEHLKYNLAPKRECHLHIVCLMDDPSPSILTTDAWLTLVKHHTGLPSTSISLLSVKDLAPDMATLSPSLRDLHATIREASLTYYLKQARHAKQKHSVLGHERQPTLLPLAARYCFKVGIFYEFQLKHEKSLKFFSLAYQHVQSYYQFLLSGSPPVDMNPQDTEVKTATVDDDTAIEVSLADASDDEEEEPPSIPQEEPKQAISGEEKPSDMTHQCRAVADWLNFKLLQASFLATALGAKEEGLLAASWQWRRHVQVMLRQSEDPCNPAWNFWAYASHQRLVMSQLVERHPPLDATVPEEVLVRCSPWRNYLAAAEAKLMLGTELRKKGSVEASAAKHGGQSMRQRFVGDLDSDGFAPKLEEVSKIDHEEKALQLTLRAIELFEQESKAKIAESESTEDEAEKPFLPSGAKLYYLAGGILVQMKRYQAAIPYLEKAASSCKKWDGLELSIRHMLVVCFRHHMPPPLGEIPNDIADSTMFTTLFQSGLSLSEIRPVLDSYRKARGSDSLKWNVECPDDSDMSLPFLFSVTFPASTHATAGDTITAVVTIMSNLEYLVCIENVTLKSATGKISVPSNDLCNAQNARKGPSESMILSPGMALLFSTDIVLPRDLDRIPLEEGSSGNATVSARPRTAGITSAAGARLDSEDHFGSEDNNGQWSKSLLGGKPLLCHGMSFLFAPVFDVPDEANTSRFIEMLIKKKKTKSVAPPKRTPFEENNYVESAWARPAYVPLVQGPRCLRVLGPMAHMVVTNLTDALVNGKALEGTVNRILLKLEAGAGECCRDITYKVTCATTVISSDGTTTHLNPEEGVPVSTEGEANLKSVGKRTPVIVAPDETEGCRRTTEFGYELPLGWRLEGTGHDSDNVIHHVWNLRAGECTYICFDLYRPPRSLMPLENPCDGDGQSADDNVESAVCETNFDINITYRQCRPAIQTRDGEGEDDNKSSGDTVVLEHSGSVVWESALLAEFSVDGRSQRAFPSGSRHPSNYLSFSELEHRGEQTELALINGERTSARCVLSSNVASDGLGIEVVRIGFEVSPPWKDHGSAGHALTANHAIIRSSVRQEKDITLDKSDTACGLHLRSGTVSGTPGVLFASKETDISRILMNGSKFGLTYVVESSVKKEYIRGSVSTRLGVIWADWYPVSIPLPENILHFGPEIERVGSHGPLRLSDPSTLKFRGPPCYIENAPFETVLESLPPSPRVAIPFEMSYRISNKTGMQQKLSVLMRDHASDDRERSGASEGVLVSGLVNGDIILGPFETQTLSYTALATKAGKTTMPALSISSDRYKTWLVKDQKEGSREIFVMP